MSASTTVLSQRDPLIERLVGESAEPARVTASARALAERAMPLIAGSLAEVLPSSLQIELETVELGRISQVFLDANNIEPLTVASSAYSPDALLMSIDVDAVSMFAGLLFGAPVSAPIAPIDRPLSGTETDVAALVFRTIAEALNGSGSRAMHVRFPLPEPICGEERRKQVHRDGPSVRLAYRVSSAGGSGLIEVTMPQRIALSPRGDEGQPAQSGDWRSKFGGEVMRSVVMLEATTSIGQLTLADIAMLEPGQVLEMPAEAPGSTRLSARGRPVFVCEFGRLGQNYTVRVKHAFDPEADLMDGLLPQ